MPILVLLMGLIWVATPVAWAQEPVPVPSDGSSVHYRTGPGDVLSVQVYGEADLSGQFPVTESGSIAHPLLGEVAVARSSIGEIQAMLIQRLSADILVDPKVSVEVRTYGSQAVRVLGAVEKPGTYFLRGPTTVLDILAEAGGVKQDKSSLEVRLKRGGDTEEGVAIPLHQLLGSGEGNAAVHAGDSIWVPEGEFVYVSGDVGKPGQVIWRDGLTVTQALAACGGPTRTANLRRTYILREGERIDVNIRRIQKGRAEDLRVRPGDRFFVKESAF